MIKELRINRGKMHAVHCQLHPQVGLWSCRIYYTLTVAHQFTDVTWTAEGEGRFRWLAYARAWWNYRQTARTFAARPGERAAKGWV